MQKLAQSQQSDATDKLEHIYQRPERLDPPREKSFFMRIGQSFFKQKSALPTDPVAQKFNAFIEMENYPVAFEMIKAGYIPTSSQNELINEAVHKMLRNQSDYQKLDTCIEFGLKLTQKEVASAMIKIYIDYSSYTGDYNILSHLVYPRFKKEFEKITESSGFSRILFDKINTYVFQEFSSTFSKRENIRNRSHSMLNIFVNHTDMLLKDIPFDDFFQFCTQIHQKSKNGIYQHVTETLNEITKNYYTQDVENVIKNSGSIAQKLLTSQIEQNIQNISVTQLDENTQQKITDIEKYYTKIKASNSPLPADESFNLANLFEKRIPEILEKYLSMNEEYRHTLTNSQGKNAHELMFEALEEVESKFENALKNINEQKLSSISALNRYTKNI